MKKQGTKNTKNRGIRKRKRRFLWRATCKNCPGRGECTKLCEGLKRRLTPEEALETMNTYTGRKQEIRLFSEMRKGVESRCRPKATRNMAAISELRYLAGLTKNEENLLYMAAIGFSHRQIAMIEGVTKQTISRWLRAIVKKAKKARWGE